MLDEQKTQPRGRGGGAGRGAHRVGVCAHPVQWPCRGRRRADRPAAGVAVRRGQAAGPRKPWSTRRSPSSRPRTPASRSRCSACRRRPRREVQRCLQRPEQRAGRRRVRQHRPRRLRRHRRVRRPHRGHRRPGPRARTCSPTCSTPPRWTARSTACRGSSASARCTTAPTCSPSSACSRRQSLAELTDDRAQDPRGEAGPVRHRRRWPVHLRALPFIWANGGDDRPPGRRARGPPRSTRPQAKCGRAGVHRPDQADDICPPQQCADLTGGRRVEAFAGGKAGMAIGGDFNRKAVEAGAVKGKYAVVPLPGKDPGSIAPAFAGGNLLGVFGATQAPTLARGVHRSCSAARSTRARCTTAMGNLPTLGSVQQSWPPRTRSSSRSWTPLTAGTKFVPADPGVDQDRRPEHAARPWCSRSSPARQTVDARHRPRPPAMNNAFGHRSTDVTPTAAGHRPGAAAARPRARRRPGRC